MKKTSFLASDLLQKEEIATLKGGTGNNEKRCGCICIGPLIPIIVENGLGGCEHSSSDGDCTDCGAANAHRATNDLISQ